MERVVYLRSPSGRIEECSLDGKMESLEYSSRSNTLGQWFLYQGENSRKIIGVHNKSRADKVGESLVFESSLDDTGEEFLVLLHSGGFKLIRLSLSPSKCPIERYHRYVDEYARILGSPLSGPRTIAGGAGAEGRAPTHDELTFRLVQKAVEALRRITSVRRDISKHQRGRGGSSGVDPVRTLEAWKQNPSWYRTTDEANSRTLRIGSNHVVPLKTVPRRTKGSNVFIGAVQAVVGDLLSTIPHTASGGTVGYLLREAARKAVSLDTPAKVRPEEGWKHLRRGRLPSRSQQIADTLLSLRSELLNRSPHDHFIDGKGPYFLYPPEIIFQWFAVSECLRALGVPSSEFPSVTQPATEGAGTQFGNFRGWIDTDNHGIRGWRDDTSAPSGYQPDLVVRNEDTSEVLLVDAKFRRSNRDDRIMSSSSIKDIQAYMNEYNLNKSVILTPYLDGDPLHEDLKSDNHWIRGLPISPDPSHESRSELQDNLSPLWNSTQLRLG